MARLQDGSLPVAHGEPSGPTPFSVGRFAHGHSGHHAITRAQLDAANAARRQAHRPDVVLGETDGLPEGGDEQHLAAALALGDPQQLIAVFQLDHRRVSLRLVEQIFERDTLDVALHGAQQEEAGHIFLGQGLGKGQHGRDPIAPGQSRQVGVMRAGAVVGDAVHGDAGGLAFGAEEEQVIARVRPQTGAAGRESRSSASGASAPARFGVPPLAHQRALGRQAHPDYLVGQDVMRRQGALHAVGDLRAARVAVAGLEVDQVLPDQRQHLLGRGQAAPRAP